MVYQLHAKCIFEDLLKPHIQCSCMCPLFPAAPLFNYHGQPTTVRVCVCIWILVVFWAEVVRLLWSRGTVWLYTTRLGHRRPLNVGCLPLSGLCLLSCLHGLNICAAQFKILNASVGHRSIWKSIRAKKC